MMFLKTLQLSVASLFCFLPMASMMAQDWPGFLGPGGTAVSSSKVPTRWNDQENLAWKLDLPGEGSSSPVIVGQVVFVTCYSESKKSFSRFVVAVDKVSGKQLWQKEFPVEYFEDEFRGYIQEHGYASNTPASDGKHLFVFFGKGGFHALDLEGNLKWSAEVGELSSSRKWGSAASVLLHENLVIVNASEEARAIIALDKETGKEIWRNRSSKLELAYGTPKTVTTSAGSTQIVISAPSSIWAMDPSNGKTVWSAKSQMTGNVSPSIIIDNQTLYSFGGYRSSGSVSVDVGGTGVGSTSGVNWKSRSTSYVATPLLHEGLFYWIDDRGLANSSRADNGEEVYRVRVKGLTGRPVYASPVMIDGKIFVVTRRSGTIIYQPGVEYAEITRNQFGSDNSDFNASPAVSENRLYLRSNKSLYCVAAE